MQIFMSATMDKIKEFIEEDNNQNGYPRTEWFGFHRDIKKRKEIEDTVLNGKEKWLIFVNNKEFGQPLKKDFEKVFLCKKGNLKRNK